MQEFYRDFVEKRDWKEFHSPKNLSMALSVEASELVEIFQWLSEKQSWNIKDHPEKLIAVQDEMADIFSYLIRLSDVLEMDLEKAFWDKFQKNAEKYPLEKSKEIAQKIRDL